MAVLIIPLALILVRARPEDMGLLPDGETVVKRNGDGTKVEPVKDTGLSLQAALRTPAFWLMGTGFITFAIANMALFQNQTPHFQDIGFSAAAAATAMSVVGIGSAIGKFSFGWLCDFIKAKYILVIGSVLQLTATIILLNITPSSPMVLIWLYALTLGLGIGSWLPALSMTVSSTFGLLAYGVIFGIMNMIFMGGGSIGPVIAGSIYDANQSYFWAFIMAIVLHCISIPAMLMVRRPQQ
jgi:predicted MFS family arabinose efflux permease